MVYNDQRGTAVRKLSVVLYMEKRNGAEDKNENASYSHATIYDQNEPHPRNKTLAWLPRGRM